MPAKIQIASLFFNIEGETKDLQKGVKDAERVIKNAFGKMAASGDAVIKSTDNLTQSMERGKKSSVDLASKMLLIERAYGDVKRVVEGGVDMARLGASMERVERRFDAFARQAGGSTELLEAFQRGAGGTVDKLNAMNTASLLLQQGLVTNATEMEKTVELATRLGNQTLSATDRMNEFGQLLRNQSIRLLDNFGISSGRVRTRIKELQDATAGLSREEAFRIAVFEEGQKALDILGERVDDNAAKFEKAQARLANWRIEMGEKFAPVVAGVMDFISQLDSVTIALVTTLGGAVGIVAKFTGGLGGLITKLNLTGAQFGLLAASVGLVIAAYETYSRIQGAVAEGQDQVNRTLETWNEMVQTAVDGGQSASDAVKDMADRVNEANAVLHANGNILEDVATSIARSTSENEIMAGAAAKARDVILEQAESVEEANKLIGLYNENLDNSKAALGEVSQATFAYTKLQENLNELLADPAIADAGDAAFVAAGEILKLQGAVANLVGAEETLVAAQETSAQLLDERRRKTEEANRAAEEAATRTLELSDILSIADEALGDTGRSLDSVRVALGEVSAEQVKVRDDIALLTRAYSEGIVSVQEFTDRIRDAEQGQLDLTFAQRKQLTEALNQKIAMEEYRASLIKTREEEEKRLQTLKDQIRSQIEQAEALKDASEQDIARAAIRRLEEAEKAGKIGFEEFTTAVVEIQDKFGLADDRSRALTSGLGELVDGLVSGSFAASEMDDALSLMIADAADGVIVFEDLVNQIGLMNSNLGETQRVFDALTGQFMQVPRMAQPTGMREISAGPAVGGGMGAIIDALTGQITQPGQQQAPSTQVFIENLNLTGVQSAEDFLASLQGVTG